MKRLDEIQSRVAAISIALASIDLDHSDVLMLNTEVDKLLEELVQISLIK